MTGDAPPGPLAGNRVLDLTTVIAGPGAARYQADYGADVLKVERPGSGDSTRQMGVPHPADGVSLYWKLVARNKRCVTVDLKDDGGRATILRLVRDAHVLIENFRPGTLERLGLGPDVLLEFEGAEAAAAPVYDMADIATEPRATMQGLVARLSATPGAIRWPGPALGEHDPPAWLD